MSSSDVPPPMPVVRVALLKRAHGSPRLWPICFPFPAPGSGLSSYIHPNPDTTLPPSSPPRQAPPFFRRHLTTPFHPVRQRPLAIWTGTFPAGNTS